MCDEVRVVLPSDFATYAWEIEFKGVLFGAHIDYRGRSIPVTFYDPARLQRPDRHACRRQAARDPVRGRDGQAISRLTVIVEDLPEPDAGERELPAESLWPLTVM